MHAAAMMSLKSIELKLGTLAEEAKRCELKLPMEIKMTARILYGGRVPTGAVASLTLQGGEGLYSRSKVGEHPRHEAEGLQGGVA
jgi:hypothetical protein